MSMLGKTFDDQIFMYSSDLGAIQRAQFGQHDCILQGCDITVSENKIYISHGWFLACGRLVLINGQEIVAPDNLITNGYIRVIASFNVSVAPVEGVFVQGSWEWDYSAITSFTALTQQDINVDGSIYKIELAIAQIASGNITTVTRTMATIKGLTNADIVNDLTSGGTDVPASAETVKTLKVAVDAKVPIASIINDLTSGGTNVPASAETVKTLNTNKANKGSWDASTFAIEATGFNFKLKIGTGTANAAGVLNTFPVAFPANCAAVFATTYGTGVGAAITVNVNDKAKFTAYASSGMTIFYIAIGY